jgi:hypothetical protein
MRPSLERDRAGRVGVSDALRCYEEVARTIVDYQLVLMPSGWQRCCAINPR